LSCKSIKVIGFGTALKLLKKEMGHQCGPAQSFQQLSRSLIQPKGNQA